MTRACDLDLLQFSRQVFTFCAAAPPPPRNSRSSAADARSQPCARAAARHRAAARARGGRRRPRDGARSRARRRAGRWSTSRGCTPRSPSSLARRRSRGSTATSPASPVRAENGAHAEMKHQKQQMLAALADERRAAPFLAAYDALIRDVVAPNIGADSLHYSAFPTVRVQQPSAYAGIRPHCDAMYDLPAGSVNWWVALTHPLRPCRTLHVESARRRRLRAAAAAGGRARPLRRPPLPPLHAAQPVDAHAGLARLSRRAVAIRRPGEPPRARGVLVGGGARRRERRVRKGARRPRQPVPRLPVHREAGVRPSGVAV